MRQMKHQFKFNPLATAILTLLCGSSLPSYAAPVSNPSTDDDTEQLKQSISEAYPGQQFFEQYYVDKSAPEAQIRNTNQLSSAFVLARGLPLLRQRQKRSHLKMQPLPLPQTMVILTRMATPFLKVMF
jgi:hypothetical protein